jgi:hypothetical protein
MKKMAIVAVISVSLGCFAQQESSTASALTRVEENLISQSHAVWRAELAKDAAALQRLVSDDFQQVGSEGKLHDKRELIDDAQEGILNDFRLYNFRVMPLDETAAIVTFDAIIHQPEGDDDLAPRYQHVSDVWVKQGEQWRLRFEQATPRRPID